MHSNRKDFFGFVVVLTVFFIVFCSISPVNHYLFRTYALDLGMYNQALFNLAHLQKPIFTLNPVGREMPFLATHFSPIIFLFTPFFYIFGSYTLLFVQIIAILAGSIGTHKLSQHLLSHKSNLPLIISIHFLSLWGVYSALTYDFHANVIGAMMVTWFVYFIEKDRLAYAWLILLMALLTMETMSVWFFFICLALIIKKRKKDAVVKLLPFLVVPFLFGILIINLVMPWLQGVNQNLQLNRYQYLGDNPLSIIINLSENPKLMLQALFTNTIGDTTYNYIKLEFHLMVMISGGLLFLFSPWIVVMTIPLYLQKMLPNDYNFWGINNQYSIEFVPMLSLAFIYFLVRIREKSRPILAAIAALLTIAATLYTMEHRVSKWYDGINTRFYHADHYKSNMDLVHLKRALKLTTSAKAVSASSQIAPLLAANKIYHYPVVKGAEYIAILKKGSHWPLLDEEFQFSIDTLRQSKRYGLIFENPDVLIFRLIPK